MATRCCTISSSEIWSANASRTARNARRGSMVPPDLEDTMNSVVRGSISDRMPRTRTGESESSVRKRTREESGLWYLVMVMGAWV